MKVYEFDVEIKKNPDMDATYVELPFDLKEEFGKRRVLVHATFDGVPYDGQAVNMGVRNADGSVCYIIGLIKSIRAKIGKQAGDIVRVTVSERAPSKPQHETVLAYIAAHSGEVRERLEKMRELVLSCSPAITEKISWGMPTFVLNGNLVHFSAETKHMGFHPTPSAIVAFSDRLTEYKCSKGTVQLPYDKPMPYDIIREMVMFRVKESSKA